jgi:hypothetical protein
VTAETLFEEIQIELGLMEATVGEAVALARDVRGREPTIREKTAGAGFLAQFYSGVENILKRTSRFHGVPLPIGDMWHADLFRLFCSPGHPRLPVLFDETLALEMAAYRKFRHVVHHGYGFQIEWGRMVEGLERVADVFDRFRDAVAAYAATLKTA